MNVCQCVLLCVCSVPVLFPRGLVRFAVHQGVSAPRAGWPCPLLGHSAPSWLLKPCSATQKDSKVHGDGEMMENKGKSHSVTLMHLCV